MVVNMEKWFNTEGEPTWRCWSVVWVHVKGEVAEPHHRHAPHTQVATAQAPVPVLQVGRSPARGRLLPPLL